MGFIEAQQLRFCFEELFASIKSHENHKMNRDILRISDAENPVSSRFDELCASIKSHENRYMNRDMLRVNDAAAESRNFGLASSVALVFNDFICMSAWVWLPDHLFRPCLFEIFIPPARIIVLFCTVECSVIPS